MSDNTPQIPSGGSGGAGNSGEPNKSKFGLSSLTDAVAGFIGGQARRAALRPGSQGVGSDFRRPEEKEADTDGDSRQSPGSGLRGSPEGGSSASGSSGVSETLRAIRAAMAALSGLSGNRGNKRASQAAINVPEVNQRRGELIAKEVAQRDSRSSTRATKVVVQDERQAGKKSDADPSPLAALLGILARGFRSEKFGFSGAKGADPSNYRAGGAGIKPPGTAGGAAVAASGGDAGKGGDGGDNSKDSSKKSISDRIGEAFGNPTLIRDLTELFKKAIEAATPKKVDKGGTSTGLGSGGSSGSAKSASFRDSVRNLIFGRKGASESDQGQQGLSGVARNINPLGGVIDNFKKSQKEWTSFIQHSAGNLNRKFNPFSSGKSAADSAASNAAIPRPVSMGGMSWTPSKDAASGADSVEAAGARPAGSRWGAGGTKAITTPGPANAAASGSRWGAGGGEAIQGAAIGATGRGGAAGVAGAAGGAGTAAGVAGSGGAAAASSLAQLAGTAAAVTGGLAAGAAAAGGFVLAMGAAAYGTKAFTETVLGSRKELATYNGKIAGTFAQLDAQRIRLGARTAGATQNSTADLGKALMKLNDALQPLTETSMQALNSVATLVADTGTGVAQITDMAITLTGIKALIQWWANDRDAKANLKPPTDNFFDITKGPAGKKFLDDDPMKKLPPL